jgi:hypothetical protein
MSSLIGRDGVGVFAAPLADDIFGCWCLDRLTSEIVQRKPFQN